MTRLRVRPLLIGALVLLALPARDAGAQPREESGGIAVLPLRSRGLSPAEHQRIETRLAASFRQSRPDVVGPEDIRPRLARDERRRAAFEEARRLVAEGASRSLNLESAAAIAAWDRAIAIWRENFGEWADPIAMADAHIRRAAERLEANPAAAKEDLLAALSIAPERELSIDDFPPRVVQAYQAARAEIARDPFRAQDPRALASLATAIGTASVAFARAEREGPADGVGVEVAVIAARLPEAPPRTARAVLPGLSDGAERLDAIVDTLSGRPSATLARNGGDVPRPDPIRTPPPVRRPPRRGDGRALWKNPWVWGTGALAILGAGFGVYSMNQDRGGGGGPGFKVILVPAPPEGS